MMLMQLYRPLKCRSFDVDERQNSVFKNYFSGLAVRVNNLLLDDYSGKSCVNFGVLRAGLAEYNFNTCASRLANCTLALSELCDEGLVTPLSVEQDWWPLQASVFKHLILLSLAAVVKTF